VISAATLEALRRYAEVGRLGEVVELTADRLDPEAGTAIRLHWDLTETDLQYGVLEIPGIGQVCVPGVGQRLIQVGAAPLEIRLIVGDEVASVRIEPRVIVPRIIEFSVPSRAMVGEPVRIVWQVAEAQTCVLVVEDGEQVHEHEVHANGEMPFVPRNPGVVRAALIARSRHAYLADRAIVSQRLETNVQAPPVHFGMPMTRKTGLVGEEVRFDWAITGATRAVLHLPDRDETRSAPLEGQMWVEVGAEVERFRIIATGLDGKEHRMEFRVIPQLLNVSHVPSELSLLNRPWE
jgi:hypothetical protein